MRLRWQQRLAAYARSVRQHRGPVLVVAIAMAIVVEVVQAQELCPPLTEESESLVYSLCHLTRLPEVGPDTVLPGYPAMLYFAERTGSVLLSAIVNDSGYVDRGSVRVDETTDRHWPGVARHGLQQLTFIPGQFQSDNVPVRMLFEFNWQLPSRQSGRVNLRSERVVKTIEATSTGFRINVSTIPRDAVPPFLETQDLDAIFVAAVVAALAVKERLAGEVACVSFDVSMERELIVLEMLREQVVDVVLGDDCPPTYGGMFASPGDPPGYVNPVRINVGDAFSWNTNVAMVAVTRVEAGAGQYLSCEIGYAPGHGWLGECRRDSGWIN